MPAQAVHFAKAKGFILAVNHMLRMDRCEQCVDPLATIAYYAAMHCFEACFADGIGCEGGRHFTGHNERVNTVLGNKAVYSGKAANGFRSLYEFSRTARYAQSGPVNPPNSGKLPSKHEIGRDLESVRHLVRRLNRVIEKVRQLTQASQDQLPSVSAPADLDPSLALH